MLLWYSEFDFFVEINLKISQMSWFLEGLKSKRVKGIKLWENEPGISFDGCSGIEYVE